MLPRLFPSPSFPEIMRELLRMRGGAAPGTGSASAAGTMSATPPASELDGTLTGASNGVSAFGTFESTGATTSPLGYADGAASGGMLQWGAAAGGAAGRAGSGGRPSTDDRIASSSVYVDEQHSGYRSSTVHMT